MWQDGLATQMHPMTTHIAPSTPPVHVSRDHHPVGLLPCLCCGEDRMYIHQSGVTFYAVCGHQNDENGSDLGGFEGPIGKDVREASLKYNQMVREAMARLRKMGL
jgi:hypothetical protein